MKMTLMHVALLVPIDDLWGILVEFHIDRKPNLVRSVRGNNIPLDSAVSQGDEGHWSETFYLKIVSFSFE